MLTRRLSPALIVPTIVALMLSGCASFAPITTADVSHTWRTVYRGEHIELKMNRNHTFVFQNMPDDLFSVHVSNGADPTAPFGTQSGTWFLAPEQDGVWLGIDQGPAAGSGGELYYDADGKGSLTFYYDDGDYPKPFELHGM